MKEHQHEYWGENKKYWKHDNERDDYMRGAKHFERGLRDGLKEIEPNPPTRKHEDTYYSGYDEARRHKFD